MTAAARGASLPGQMLPQTVPLSKPNAAGEQIIDINWYLLLYNLVRNVLQAANAGSVPLTMGDGLALIDGDVIEGDAQTALSTARMQAALSQLSTPTDDVPAWPRDIANLMGLALDTPAPTNSDTPYAVALALESPFADFRPAAQPVASIAVGASPFTYTANFTGTVAVAAGTVTSITLVRQGTSVAVGVIAGLIPVSRSDQVTVVYAVAPTMTFIPA